MKELFWAFYFALHFAGAFLGLVIAINLSTWLGLGMFAFFLVKFMLMLPEIKRIWIKLIAPSGRPIRVRRGLLICILKRNAYGLIWNLSPGPCASWVKILYTLCKDLGSSWDSLERCNQVLTWPNLSPDLLGRFLMSYAHLVDLGSSWNG